MNYRSPLLSTLGIFLAPVALSGLFKILLPFSIGPVVLIYSLGGTLVLAGIWGGAIRNFLKVKFESFALVAGIASGIAIGITFGILLINFFMEVTKFFGIMNYDTF